MARLITDTKEPCKPYCLNLPASYGPLFDRITDKGASRACRMLVAYALEHGALAALTAPPTPEPLDPDLIPGAE